MAKPVKFAHVVYNTWHFKEMIEWYESVFEAKVVHENPMIAFLTYDDEHHRFAFLNMNAFKPDGTASRVPADAGVNHVAYTYANVGELLETYGRLKEAGVMPYWRVHHGVTLSLYYKDPDGNRMEFQVDCCETAEDANNYMLSDAFRENPIGVEIDPDAMLEQFRSGVPMEQLIIQPQGAPSPLPAELGLSH